MRTTETYHMSFEKFYGLFHNALLAAVKSAEEQLHRELPQKVKIELHGAGRSGDLVAPVIAAQQLYLGEEIFYRIIDVAVIKVSKTECTVFVRPSAHTPGAFNQTWNKPPGSGPFKQLFAEKIVVEE
jgi:hypothetical protein